MSDFGSTLPKPQPPPLSTELPPERLVFISRCDTNTFAKTGEDTLDASVLVFEHSIRYIVNSLIDEV